MHRGRKDRTPWNHASTTADLPPSPSKPSTLSRNTSTTAPSSPSSSIFSRCAPQKSTAAPSASTCTPKTPLGETEQRLYELNAWRETPFYTDRERAALEWTEVLTLVSETHALDESYERLRAHFSDKEIVDLTYIISAINVWNRIGIGLRSVPGHYQPARKSSSASCICGGPPGRLQASSTRRQGVMLRRAVCAEASQRKPNHNQPLPDCHFQISIFYPPRPLPTTNYQLPTTNY